jgi:hypothetical protein
MVIHTQVKFVIMQLLHRVLLSLTGEAHYHLSFWSTHEHSHGQSIAACKAIEELDIAMMVGEHCHSIRKTTW